MTTETIRQGDILLKKINKIEGRKIGDKKRVLAYGEKTGHSHIMQGDVTFYENNGQTLCQVHSNAELIHQEHNRIDIPKGEYLVIRQREFDVVEGIRTVSD